MHDTHTINSYFYIDFCECDTCIILIASVGLAQARPNYRNYEFWYLYIRKTELHKYVVHINKFIININVYTATNN